MVPKKIYLAIIFQEIKNWNGGFNYYCSLITILKLINFDKNFKYIIFIGKKNTIFLKKKLKINKKYIFSSSVFEKISLLKIISKILELIFKRDVLLDYILKKRGITILSHFFIKINEIKTIPWIPDLQHKYLKNLFSSEEINNRDKIINNYLTSCSDIIVSSKDTKNSIKKFYRIKNNTIHVLNFIPQINFNYIYRSPIIPRKFGIFENYIYVPNQFWAHKNHEIIVKAALELKKKNFFIKFILSGYEKDYRNKNYFNNIKKLITSLDVNNYFEYLGQVSRKDLLNLIYHAQIIINPSKFEGWSTTVEEAKILNKRLLLSNIPVHNEQINENCVLFSTKDEHDLATKIIKTLNQNFPSLDLDYLLKNYLANRKKFAHQYLNILKEVSLK